MTDVLVIGAGPAGLYAAYYAGFRGFTVTVLDVLTEPGGQITAMYPEKEIFDVAGFPAVKGRDLVDGLMKQAGAFNPTFILGERAEELLPFGEAFASHCLGCRDNLAFAATCLESDRTPGAEFADGALHRKPAWIA